MTKHHQTQIKLSHEEVLSLLNALEGLHTDHLDEDELATHDRLIRRLVHLAREDASPVKEGMLIRRRPTQQDLANMVGSCRETVSRTFNHLARQGLIIPRGRALVVTNELAERISPLGGRVAA